MSTDTAYPRFALHQRIEHLVMLLTFTTLAVTGLPQKYAAAGWAETTIALLGGIETTRIIHRFAATLMMLGAVYHLAAVSYRLLVRRVRLTMLPTLQDARDALQAFLFNLGLAERRPQLGRYTYEEKAEYWAFVWGTVVMVITGFMMWNPIATARFLPGQFIPAAKAAHGGEALLAALAIVVWHMYGVHLRHFNKSMWTGRLTEEEMLHEHPLELADIKAGLAERPVAPAVLRKRQAVFFPVAGAVTVAMMAGLYFFVTFEQTAIATLPPLPDVVVYAPQTPTPLPTRPPTPTSAPVTALTWDAYAGPLFQKSCSACHGAIGGLSLGSYADAMRGGNSGAVILPGDSAGSKLMLVQAAGGHPGQLSGDDLTLVKDWIDAGAPEK